MKGIDVSRYQGEIDWVRVKADGVDFAILRAGYGRLRTQYDPYFAKNYAGARGAGLMLGCYWFSYAPDAAAAKAEAQACLAVLGGRSFELGVWFDQEYVQPVLQSDNKNRTAAVAAFLADMAAAGYTAGLYCSTDWLKKRLYTAQLTDTNLWIAQYGKKCTAPLSPCIWQYTSTGSVAGIRGNVDCDELYFRPGRPNEGEGWLAAVTLSRGARGAAVKQLQSVLNRLGFSAGAADGIFGAKTQAAVRAFQRSAGLAADGIVGPKTRRAAEAVCRSGKEG